MSRTRSSLLLETNQKRGLAQENAFLLNAYRVPAEFNATYNRSATSDSPIQIFALASAQGDDTVSAMALQGAMRIIARYAAQAQNMQSMNSLSVSEQLIAELNQSVCSFSAKNNYAPLRMSLTVLFIENDSLRVLHVGNTRALLVREGNVIALTEDQTVAHRYVQSGAISPDMERTHPEHKNLTQFIGRHPEDGMIQAENKVSLSLRPGDEIVLLGVGITEAISIADRNAVLLSGNNPEYKTAELMRAAQMTTKGGLSVMVIKVSNATPSLTGTSAAASSSLVPAPAQGIRPMEDTSSEEDPLSSSSPKNSKAKAILIPIGVFLACLLVGYFGAMLLFRIGNVLPATTTPTDASAVSTLGKIKYVTSDMVAFYPDASLDSTPSRYLARGEVVIYYEDAGSFSKVKTTDGVEGYVLTVMISDQDPTIGESEPEMSADPTPIPSQEQTAVTASSSETSATTTAAASSSTETTTTTTAALTATPSPSASSEETTTSTSEETTTTAATTSSESSTQATTTATTAGEPTPS